MVEAIETLFVPVLIHNNKPGRDAQILKQYNEPSWNNPVIRYLDGNGKDVIARKDRVWTTGGTAARMVAALKAAKRKVPSWLQFVADEHTSEVAHATFAMHCYWVGEVNLGGINGVLRTQAGWIGNKEVVRVVYNPKVVGYSKLLKAARKLECASTVFTHDASQMKIAKAIVGNEAVPLPDKSNQRRVRYTEEKYHLRRQPELRYLPLTQMQLAKINSAVITGEEYRGLLSPRQLELQKQVAAVLKVDQKRLAALTVPDDPTKLKQYSEKLTKLLAKR